ncbi:tRNA 5-methoxyuridine(34)/uridine 5-oxyacetic acid(34) synthase CmoB [Denitrificimonas sp. JX-1]|uniref:tRNA U34 carboxymethyltransferase n=1 Tax=Denitrificimonas halotolerans TaxID=3098930 RepID=A0ABU5GRD1_9GAMM|nr:tRNA 5-methoxyuridine(34)/uridine 5-oxyacetic acid(34) synthase CmoB [Denitrificimonas sp. JX-1]MDY7218173.1 tRNA 5-methoxyuridine(34)/uridine 5-oxyacetic acid(34) synthase CmoB [Denitrificimonas sp. JX-1]
MIDLTPLIHHLARTPLETWSRGLQQQFDALYATGHGDLARWSAAVEAIPTLTPTFRDTIKEFRIDGPCSATEREQLRSALQGLIPWRKGPFHVFDVHIDTEWRSDWKWDRVSPHLDLNDKRILDVGCGNGYYMWRMLGAGAKTVIGIDPNWLFFCQFQAMLRFFDAPPVWHLPFALEDLPAKLEGFDTVFSMGVLYHRRSPIDHLLELKNCLINGGELVLETLVIEGDCNQVLVPKDRYAKMRNVWFLPSVDALELWLRRAGFKDIRCVDISHTTTSEQRTTDWMKYHSLIDFLDPQDPSKTVEGLPAPMRAVMVARKP